MAPPLNAKVKSVLSGDSIVLTPVGKPDQERTLSLAYVTGPRLASNEPYGFAAREALRALLVGKQVQFRVLYTVNNREFGDVISPVFESLIEKCLAEGIAKLRDDASSKADYDKYNGKLEVAQDKAKNAGAGVWGSNLAVVETEFSAPEYLFKNDKPYTSIIEKVISGDRLQVRTILDNKKNVHFVGPVLIAGLKAPRTASQETAGEPFGEAAKLFVQTRLLQRSVGVNFLEKSASGVPIVTVSHPAGDIAQLLLTNGLASIADWQSQFLGAQKMSALRAAEKQAKDGKLNMWKDTSGASTGTNSKRKSFEAVVARVISSDTYVIRDQDGKEQTVQLASIRAPRKNEPAQSPYVPLAKEFAREKLIAKKVNVTIEAVRPKSEHFEERALVTMEHNGHNVATSIVANGHATVIRHRKDNDDDRSPIWDELVEKESQAISTNKGMHSKKAPPINRIVEASETVTKARGFLASLERQNRVNAVVEHVSSGGRIKLHVPKENCILALVLSGVRVPKPNEAHGDEALDFVSRRVLQRDVQISVSDVDKTGAFIGHIYMPGKNIPLSIALVKEGLAEVNEFSAQKSGYYQQLIDAEEESQKAKKGIWENYVPEEEQPADPAPTPTSQANSTSATRNYQDITVTDVSSRGQISYRLKSSSEKFDKLCSDLNSFNNAGANSSHFSFKGHPKRGEMVTVRIKGGYYRARLLSFEKPKYTVQLLDTGAIHTTTIDSLRPLPSQFSVATIPSLAKTAELSFVQYPPLAYMEDYVAYLEETINNKDLVANIDSPPSIATPSVTLYTAESKGKDDSINSALIDQGYAFVKPKLTAWERSESWKPMLDALKELEADAKADRVGVWEYGDPRDLDE